MVVFLKMYKKVIKNKLLGMNSFFFFYLIVYNIRLIFVIDASIILLFIYCLSLPPSTYLEKLATTITI